MLIYKKRAASGEELFMEEYKRLEGGVQSCRRRSAPLLSKAAKASIGGDDYCVIITLVQIGHSALRYMR